MDATAKARLLENLEALSLQPHGQAITPMEQELLVYIGDRDVTAAYSRAKLAVWQPAVKIPGK